MPTNTGWMSCDGCSIPMCRRTARTRNLYRIVLFFCLLFLFFSRRRAERVRVQVSTLLFLMLLFSQAVRVGAKSAIGMMGLGDGKALYEFSVTSKTCQSPLRDFFS